MTGDGRKYWELAGQVGYVDAMSADADVGRLLSLRIWNEMMAAATTVGILHHVKAHAAAVAKQLAAITDKVLILEPNGFHPVRKLLEPLVEAQAGWLRNLTLTNVVLGFKKKSTPPV